MHKLMLATALCTALGFSLGAETAFAKAADHSARRAACRVAGAVAPLKLLRPAVLVENGVNGPAGRMSRRAYTPVPSVANAREQALVLLERQPKPTNLMVGVGF